MRISSSYGQGKRSGESCTDILYGYILQLLARKALHTPSRSEYTDIVYGYPSATGNESVRHLSNSISNKVRTPYSQAYTWGIKWKSLQFNWKSIRLANGSYMNLQMGTT